MHARLTINANKYQGSINYCILMTLQKSSLCSMIINSGISKFSDCYINGICDAREFPPVVWGIQLNSLMGEISCKKEKK